MMLEPKSFKYYLKQSIVILSVILFGGCGEIVDTPHKLLPELPEVEILDETSVENLNDCIGIYNIDIVGDYFLCAEKRVPEFYRIYDSDFKLQLKFGRQGRSKKEFIAPLYLGQYDDCGDSLFFNIFDRALCRYDTWVFDKKCLLLSKSDEFVIPSDRVFDIRALYRLADNKYCGISDYDECKFFTVSKDFSHRIYHDNIMQFNSGAAHEISQSTCAISPDLSKVAVAYYNFPQLDIRSSDGEILNTVFIEKVLRPNEIDRNNVVDYFIKVVADNNYIYALYNEIESETNDSILIFDWDGNLLHRYSVNKALSFCIDKKKRFVVVNRDQTESLCSVYDVLKN